MTRDKNLVISGLHYTRAIALIKLGKLEKAIESLHRELKISPRNEAAQAILSKLISSNIGAVNSARSTNFVPKESSLEDSKNRGATVSFRHSPPLDSIIPPEIKGDEFYQEIVNLIQTEKIDTILEIGSSDGRGSTEAIINGILKGGASAKLFCVEISKTRFQELQKRYIQFPFINFYNVSSVPPNKFLREEEVVQFYNSQNTSLNKYPLREVLHWLDQDKKYVQESGVHPDGISKIKRENNITYFDMVLIDGSAFTGSAELKAVYGAKYILLDDINDIKNYQNYKRLSSDPHYVLLKENWKLRNGYAIFMRIFVPLPIHFFSIVLNGEPFIRYHLEVFNKLPVPWHWHIVEGVADFKHDTSWCSRSGGRITEFLHKNGLSNDGTTEYLDEISTKYSENITIYRKPNGSFWDGKLEMVNAPLNNIKEICLLWQIDVDELWTSEQILKAHKMFLENPQKTAAYYYCHFFVGPKLVITTRNTYGNNTSYEWLRTWRYKPGDCWVSHEPPSLCRQISTAPTQWVNLANIDPFTHEETEKAGLIFQHYAYVTEKQLRFKETYYGYTNAVKQWKELQKQLKFPVLLRHFFPWVKDHSLVDTTDRLHILPLYTIYTIGPKESSSESGTRSQKKEELSTSPGDNCVYFPHGSVLTASMLSKRDKVTEKKNRKRKNILVVSHERSGTHFLINTIAFNFPYYSNYEISVKGNSKDLHQIFSYFYSKEEKRILKSHHQFYFFVPFFDEILRHFHVFYLVRDGRDVLTSCYHYFNASPPESFPHTTSFAEFLRTSPSDFPFDNEYSYRISNNMVTRWANHIESWLKQEMCIHLIKYEDLKSCFEKTVARISDILGFKTPDHFVKPTLKDRVIFPRKGEVGDWRNHFTDSDLAFFDSICAGTMKRLGYYKTVPGADSESKKILWIRTDSIGDNVLAASMLPYIRKAYEGAEIVALCQKHIAEIYEVCPHIDSVVSFDRARSYSDLGYRNKITKKLKASNFDLALNSVFSREPITDFFALESGAREKIALQGDTCNLQNDNWLNNNRLYPSLISIEENRLLELERHRKFLQGLGIKAGPLSPAIWLKDEDKEKGEKIFLEFNLVPQNTIVLFAGAQWAGRTYRHFGKALSQICKDMDLAVIALGSEREYEINELNLQDINATKINLCGKTTIRQSAAILSMCRIAVGTETGLAHIACAVGTPNIVLLGGGHFGRFMPYSPLTSIVCLPLNCYGCNWHCKFQKVHCVKDIEPNVLSNAIRHRLTSGSDRPRAFVQGHSLWKAGENKPTWKLFDKFIDLDQIDIYFVGTMPLSLEAVKLNQKGKQLFSKNDIEGAINYFKNATELDETFSEPHNNLGVAYWQNGKGDKALFHFKRALEIDPKNTDAVLNLGQVYEALGESEKARALYSDYLTKDPDDREVGKALKSLNSCYFSNNHIEIKNNIDKHYLVSAIVSTYNSERFIRGCLEDLEAQTIRDRLEIIVVDSGSEQNEAQIVREFQKQYDNIVYIRTDQREGVYAAWNRGIKAARGKYITNANTDDRHRSDAFEKMALILDQRPDIALVYANVWITETENETFENHTRVGIYRWADYDPLYLTYGCFIGPQPMWRKTLHEKYGYFDESFESAGDWEFWLRISETEKFFHIDEVLGLYLKSPSSVEHRDPMLSRNEAMRVYKIYSPRRLRLEKEISEKLKRVEKLANSGKIDKAEEILKQLISIFPYHPKIRNDFAYLLWQRGRGEEALEHLRFAINRAPDDADIVWNCGQVLLEYGYLDDAVTLFEAFLNRHPENNDIQEILSRLKSSAKNTA